MNEPPIYFDRSPVPYDERQALVEHIVTTVRDALVPFVGRLITGELRATMIAELRNAFACSADRGEMVEWGVRRYADIAGLGIDMPIEHGSVSPRLIWADTALARFTGPR